MWCEHCQSEVAAEFAADGHSLLCTACRQPLKSISAPSLHPQTQSARDFLEKWSREQQRQMTEHVARAEADQHRIPGDGSEYRLAAEQQRQAAASSPARLPQPAVEADDERPAPRPTQKPKFRVDAEHASPARPRSHKSAARQKNSEKQLQLAGGGDEPPRDVPVANAQPPRPRRHRVDAEHQGAAPHFDVRVGAPVATKTPGRSEAMWGQLLAYLGVGALTGGAVLVLWGYFGGIEAYASTGWLITTAGQMVLLLGIVTLIGGGMQQTTHEVSQRIEHLGGRMIRIEQSTDKILKGPHFSRSRKRARQKISESAGEQEENL